MPQSTVLPPATSATAVACSACSLRAICLPVGLAGESLARVDARMVASRRRLQRGEPLFRQGDAFDALYAVWTGSFKTRALTTGAREQVTGFQMGGELIGLDAIATGTFQADAVALESAQVCVIPFDALQSLAQEEPSLQRQLQRVMSLEIVQKQRLMLLLGGTAADQRVAAFLLDLAQRAGARGFSPSSLLLRMTRREIGSLLGLTLETVSRALSRLQRAGLLFVRWRQVRIADPAGLQRLLQAEPA